MPRGNAVFIEMCRISLVNTHRANGRPTLTSNLMPLHLQDLFSTKPRFCLCHIHSHRTSPSCSWMSGENRSLGYIPHTRVGILNIFFWYFMLINKLKCQANKKIYLLCNHAQHKLESVGSVSSQISRVMGDILYSLDVPNVRLCTFKALFEVNYSIYCMWRMI